jgi:hypothetical protein
MTKRVTAPELRDWQNRREQNFRQLRKAGLKPKVSVEQSTMLDIAREIQVQIDKEILNDLLSQIYSYSAGT